MLIPKFLFFRLKSLLEILGYTLESIDKYYPKYLNSVPRKSRNISLYSPLGGYSISRLSHDFILRFGLLSDYLIDVGANRGNFSEHVFQATGISEALLVEPIPELAGYLKDKYKGELKIRIFEKALSDTERETKFYIATNDGQSSSLTAIGERHLIASPDTTMTQKVNLKTTTLDLITSDLTSQKIFLKIDVQGHELEVLKGSTKILEQVIAIHLEISNQHLYQGDSLGFQVWEFLNERGFTLYGMDPWFRDNQHNGELIQADFFFIRNDYLWENFFKR